MLRSDALVVDNKLFPLYQERVTSLTFTTEHNNEHLDADEDEEHCDKSLVMTGMGRRAGNKKCFILSVYDAKKNV